jgi:tetratricopeptide (TPR) repeat protein
MNTSPSPFSAHKDVLEASIPDGADKGKKQSLLEECKRRAKGAVQSKCWPDAAALYDKALQCCDDDAGEECAILNANLSLVHGKMNHWQKALECAETATRQNPLYVKAWWRLGQAQAALQRWDSAVSSLQQAQSLEPNNKALEKELIKLQEQQQQQQQQRQQQQTQNEKAAAIASSSVTTTVTRSSSSNAATSNSSNNKPVDMDVDIEKDTAASNSDVKFKKSEPFKGYKIVNGKKTTYFHNELSEEAKQLIGDIAPKKLDSSAIAVSDTSTTNTIADSSRSAWNKAGTWEEKDVTKWAKETLEQTLLGGAQDDNASTRGRAVYTLPLSSAAPNATVTTTSVKILSGHASVATVRGKKRYLYDFALKLDWKFQHGDSITANGSIEFPDVAVGTGGGGEDDGDGNAFEATHFTVAHADDETLRPILQTFVHHDGWRNLIHSAIHDWVQLFKETY